jgi:hypothetical protein
MCCARHLLSAEGREKKTALPRRGYLPLEEMCIKDNFKIIYEPIETSYSWSGTLDTGNNNKYSGKVNATGDETKAR